MIDLRSDTVTRPTAAMREAMARAEVGDDVFGDDPTVHALEEEVARITGKEAALFVTSGTMGNQLAIATQTRPGDDVDRRRGRAPGVLRGRRRRGAQRRAVQRRRARRLLHGRRARGGDAPARLLGAAHGARRRSRTRTTAPAAASGRPRRRRAVAERAQALGLATHLDGARIWNASVASGVDVATLCAPFDTVSVCFSKGLGAPVGSAFCGPQALVEEARRLRKRWGGAMRQSGILAAAALHALAHHRTRLSEDHANARALAETLARDPGRPGRPVDASRRTSSTSTSTSPADAVSRDGARAGSAHQRHRARSACARSPTSTSRARTSTPPRRSSPRPSTRVS